MALSIKSHTADRLARELVQLTGETITEAVTKALAERLQREREVRKAREEEVQRLLEYAAQIRKDYDLRPVTKQEIDEMWGDDVDLQ